MTRACFLRLKASLQLSFPWMACNTIILDQDL
jgi:hypothetical protein